MSLLTVVLVIITIGILMWLVNTYIPMGAGMKKILNIVVICVVVIWLLKVFGLLNMLNSVNV